MCISYNMERIYQCIDTIYQNPFIISKDIEKNWNFNISQGQ